MSAKSALVVALLLLPLSTGPAQSYVTTAAVNLRRTPSSRGHIIRVLARGETLTVRPATAHPGFLAVRTTGGEDGWASRAHLRKVVAAGVVTDTTHHAFSDTAHIIANGNAPFDKIDPTWVKSAIAPSTISVKGGAASCGPDGDGGDAETNEHKNRADTPTETHWATVDAIRALPDTALWRHKAPNNVRTSWTASDRAIVTPYEGIPLTVVGYFQIVKPQSARAPAPGQKVGESPNCHSWLESDTDWHIALVASPDETEDRAVVVEPTPRTKRANPGWIPSVATALAVRHSPSDTPHIQEAAQMRVTGFLMLDPVHVDHIRGSCTSACDSKHFFRATLWELHPVTRIEVWKNNAWVNLNDYRP